MSQDILVRVQTLVKKRTAQRLWELAEARNQRTIEFLRDLLDKICEN